VPETSRGFHCGQPDPRKNTTPMAGKSPQPSHKPPFQGPITLIGLVVGLKRGGAWGGKLCYQTAYRHTKTLGREEQYATM